MDLRIMERVIYYHAVGDPMAELLALRSLLYATRTGGFVPMNALDELGRGIADVPARVRFLVAHELWTEVEWGWTMDIGRSRHVVTEDDRWRLTKELRQAVLEHDDFTCQACGITENLHIDHIVPVARGGKTEFENLQVLCGSCNSSKGAKDWHDWLAST